MSCVFRVWLSEIRLHVIGTLGLERIKLPTIVESLVNLKFRKDKNAIIVKRTVIAGRQAVNIRAQSTTKERAREKETNL